MENDLQSVLERQIQQLKLQVRDGNRFMFIGFGIMLAFLIYDLFIALETGTTFYLIYFFTKISRFGIIVSLAGLIGHYLFSFIGLIIAIVGIIRKDRARQKMIPIIRQLNELKNN